MKQATNQSPVYLFSPTLLDSEAVASVQKEFGMKGELAVFKLLCEIARNGYYAEWNEEARQRVLDTLPGVSANLLDMIINSLVRNRFFDRVSYERHGILTSARLQESFFRSEDNRRQMLPYLLVDLSVRYRNKNVKSELIVVSSEETRINSEETKNKQSFIVNNTDYGTSTEVRS